ncbi:DUF1566 domain-containing protein [bacterium]|nr:DUF1566 domain-containing protein [bacterium]
MPAGNCAKSDTRAELTPAWTEAASASADSAYCCYRLGLNPALAGASLALSWIDAAPDGGDLWLGLSDWVADTWAWRNAADAGFFNIEDPGRYADTDSRCLVALVVLGDTQVQLASIGFGENGLPYPIVDTNQLSCYNDNGQEINPTTEQAYFGQDAQYTGNQPAYQDNGDGTVTDLVTGLMWAKTPNNLEKVTFSAAFDVAANLELGGYDDWRVPTIKELYSLILFDGETGSTIYDSIPYLMTSYLDFEYGDESAGERIIDAQYWSATEYVSTTMGGSPTTFGVNFADGRIKGYGRENPQGGEMTQFIRCVRGNPAYGSNDFVDNGDGTITDRATGLTWMQVDSGALSAGPRGDGTLNWEEALAWAEDLEYAGSANWRLPNAKELESIVDYTRSPATTASAAIDPLFSCTPITDEGGSTDYAFYWTGTTHLDGPADIRGDRAAYVSFGEGHGWMQMPPDSGNYVFLDVHGAGCQRSDPKSGDPADYPYGLGPQGDVLRIYNLVRCVLDD